MSLDHIFSRQTNDTSPLQNTHLNLYSGTDAKWNEANASKTYMRLIFGGDPSNEESIDRMYTRAQKKAAESRASNTKALKELKFAKDEKVTKDDLLEAFADQRRHADENLDSEAERFLKSRVTHNILHPIFNGKRLERFDHVHGQNNTILHLDHADNFYPTENISVKSRAPNGMGERNPLDFAALFGNDPRQVKINDKNDGNHAITAEPDKTVVYAPEFRHEFKPAGLTPANAGLAALFKVK